MSRDWDESEHPRHPKKASGGRGGEFRRKRFIDTTKVPDWAEQIDKLYQERESKREHDRMSGAQREALGALSRNEVSRGLSRWISNPAGYKRLAAALRGKGTVSADTARSITLIDSVMERPGAVLGQDLQVFRGVNNAGQFKLTPGAEFTDPSYMSTSMRASWAGSFTDYEKRVSDPVLFRIRVPAGSRGLFADAISDDLGELAQSAGIGSESEFVMPRGTRLRVIGPAGNTEFAGLMKNGRIPVYSVPVWDVEVVRTPKRAPLPAAVAAVVAKLGKIRDLGKVGEGKREVTWSEPGFLRAQAVDAIWGLLRKDGRYGDGRDRSMYTKLTPEEIGQLSDQFNVSVKSVKLLLRKLAS